MASEKRQIHFEAVPVEPAASLAVRHFMQETFPFRWHYHSEVELTLIVKGQGLRFIGDSIAEYRKGDLCLLGANLPHTWSSPPGVSSVHSICAQFLESFVGEPFLALPECSGIRTLLREKARRGIRITGKTAKSVSEIVLEMGDQRLGSMREILLLLDALHQIADNPQDQQPLSRSDSAIADNHTEAKIVTTVMALLNESIGDVLPSQAQIAAKVSMTPGSFSRFFQRVVGKRYIDYLNEWRIGIACRLLLETDDPIIDVALASGFEGLANFHRRFRHLKGVTPGQFRNAARSASRAENP